MEMKVDQNVSDDNSHREFRRIPGRVERLAKCRLEDMYMTGNFRFQVENDNIYGILYKQNEDQWIDINEWICNERLATRNINRLYVINPTSH